MITHYLVNVPSWSGAWLSSCAATRVVFSCGCGLMARFLAFGAAAHAGVVGAHDVAVRPAVAARVVFAFSVWKPVAFVEHRDSVGLLGSGRALVVGSANGVHFVAE
jgi:hypothetical protein